MDILFNCAGYVAVGTVLECEPDDWERSFSINVRSMFDTIRAFLPGMIAKGGGRIVNMAVGGELHEGNPLPRGLRRHQGRR